MVGAALLVIVIGILFSRRTKRKKKIGEKDDLVNDRNDSRGKETSCRMAPRMIIKLFGTAHERILFRR